MCGKPHVTTRFVQPRSLLSTLISATVHRDLATNLSRSFRVSILSLSHKTRPVLPSGREREMARTFPRESFQVSHQTRRRMFGRYSSGANTTNENPAWEAPCVTTERAPNKNHIRDAVCFDCQCRQPDTQDPHPAVFLTFSTSIVFARASPPPQPPSPLHLSFNHSLSRRFI